MTLDGREKPELDFVRVGEHSRRVARTPVFLQSENLQRDLESLSVRKREIESLLAQAKDDMLAEKAKIISGRYKFSESKRRHDEIAEKERAATANLRKEL